MRASTLAFRYEKSHALKNVVAPVWQLHGSIGLSLRVNRGFRFNILGHITLMAAVGWARLLHSQLTFDEGFFPLFPRYMLSWRNCVSAKRET